MGPILGLVCECGDDDCQKALVMTSAEYRAMRSREHHFAVTPEHIMPGVDIVRRRHLRFVTVETPGA